MDSPAVCEMYSPLKYPPPDSQQHLVEETFVQGDVDRRGEERGPMVATTEMGIRYPPPSHSLPLLLSLPHSSHSIFIDLNAIPPFGGIRSHAPLRTPELEAVHSDNDAWIRTRPLWR
jgi:hypothetical protein